MPFSSRWQFLLFFNKFSTTIAQLRPKKARPVLKFALIASGAYYVYYSYNNYREAIAKESFYNIPPYKLVIYRTLPLACITRIMGKVASLQVPEWLRSPFYGTFAWLYGCNLDESNPLSSYRTFNEFFTRTLRPGLRPISNAELVSPADGKILAFGNLRGGDQELFPDQIKGVNYPLKTFIGPHNSNSIEQKTDKTSLYYCTIYLAPGSYHRFHCPVDNYRVEAIERVSGEVLPVAPWVLRLIPGLLTLNERVVVAGQWKYGKMFIVPVGATNVRSISLSRPRDIDFMDERFIKGQEIGKFEMGSLVALIFEAPEDFQFTLGVNSWIKYGQALGNSTRSKSWWVF